MKHLLLLTTILCFLLGCGKNKKCNQEDTFSGIVLQQLDISGDPNYAAAGVRFSSGFLITNDSVYKAAFHHTTNLPFIDFTQYDLLGNAGGGYCKISFHKEVTADFAAKNYHYRLIVYSCSTYHPKGCSSYNWVLVPKLPQGWTVTFEVIKGKNK
jgi:hypothetical protein